MKYNLFIAKIFLKIQSFIVSFNLNKQNFFNHKTENVWLKVITYSKVHFIKNDMLLVNVVCI
jgi:hypothetical protein